MVDEKPSGVRATIGSFLGIRAGSAYLVGVLVHLAADRSRDGLGMRAHAEATLDLLGEIYSLEGRDCFKRGTTHYPAIGDAAELLSTERFQLVYQVSGPDRAEIGSLHQNRSIPACIKIDDLLSKHFAILGSTGVGKSSGVAIILDEVMNARPDVRVFLLDGHNEYGGCFGARANVISPRNLRLPFWLFNLEETVDVIYGGRPPVAEEIEILAELIPIAKAKYAQYKDASDRQGLKRSLGKSSGYTVDTPVPYVLQDLLSLIDERMGRLENRASRMNYHRLITRIEVIRNDPRYAFMFENANVGGDMMGELLAQLFRLDADGRPMTIMQLAGLPTEVVDAVVCVLCRLAFEFGIWSEGAIPLLFVCEEAHRYAAADHSIGFTPTRRALSRVAKEGRKHGVFLGLVTQRPAELDPTVISQCSTVFAMRMSNDRDQAFLRAAVSDSAKLLSFVPSLGTGEVIAFGEGVPLPARLSFRELPENLLPRIEVGCRDSAGLGHPVGGAFVDSVIERWRGATMNKTRPDTAEIGSTRALRAPAAEPTGASALEKAHQRLLKRPLEAPEVLHARSEAMVKVDLWRQR